MSINLNNRMTPRVFYFMILVCLFSITETNAQAYRSYDGSNNNIENPLWGASHTPLLRIASVDYADSISQPKLDETYNKPNPRVVSNMLFAQDDIISDKLALSDFTWVFGQFIDHDISLTENNPQEILENIVIPEDDQHFAPGVKVIMSRSMASEGTGTDKTNPRQHDNMISSFLDASGVYGSDEERANWLRTFEGGKLKTSEGNLLPWNTVSGNFNDAIDFSAPTMADDTHSLNKYFVAGDVRANENPLLISFHTLFLREHNRLCDELKVKHPDWTDELLYQRARKLVGGFIQHITFDEWMPTMGIKIPEYTGYKPNVRAVISNEFSAAAFRLGHTLVNSNIIRMDNDGGEMPGGNMRLKDAFFNPVSVVLSGGVDPFLKGMATQVQQEMDCKVVDDIRNFLFGSPSQGGLDLAAININRGRERGIPTYNQIRRDLGMPPVNSFYTLTKDVEVAAVMEEVYGDINNLDAWVGMVSESHVSSGALFGEVMMNIIEDQFQALRDGDRYYYEVDPILTDAEVAQINNTWLRDIIMRNTSISLMQDEVFKAMPHTNISTGPTINEFNFDAELYPNPTFSETTLKYHSDIDQSVYLSVYDYQGRVVFTKELHAYAGSNFFDMSIPDYMPRGLYNVILQNDYGYNILKLVKEQ